jgi:hypothetical protein
MDDRNYYTLRRDEELKWAAAANCEQARESHTALAALFEDEAKKFSLQHECTNPRR